MDNENCKEIENSEELQKSLQENSNVETTKEYKNSVANKISNLSAIILVGGILIGVLGALSIISITEEFTIITPAILLVITSFVSSLLLTGLAEIIELLQSIKDK